ncbi:uncharacterized protein B0H64DRAFT_431970 [Chaetomium fimeti]|uniref:Uncharacterized protein n=1 Tax=Chaetomium fimeti TaxID=1854472 RepID=A0AAE0LRI3_9PEZI|nr:hypothetical protein B0H64DRAFT_431970 [Chaetomium fimeti]
MHTGARPASHQDSISTRQIRKAQCSQYRANVPHQVDSPENCAQDIPNDKTHKMEQLNNALASLQARLVRLDHDGITRMHADLRRAFVLEAQDFATMASTLVVQLAADRDSMDTRMFELEEAFDTLREDTTLALSADEREHAAQLSEVEADHRQAQQALAECRSQCEAANAELHTVKAELSSSQKRLADRAKECKGLQAQVVNFARELERHEDGSRIRRSMVLKRKRNEETPIDVFWRSQAREVHEAFLDIHPDPHFAFDTYRTHRV